MFWFYCLLCTLVVGFLCVIPFRMGKHQTLLKCVAVAIAAFAYYCHYMCMVTGAYTVFSNIVAKRVVRVVQYYDHHTPFVRILIGGLGFATDTLNALDKILNICEVIVFLLLIVAVVGACLYYAFRFLFKRN